MSDRFDELARAAAQPASRRGVLKLLGGAATAAAAATVLKPFRGDACVVACNDITSAGFAPCAAGTTPCGGCCCKAGVGCIDRDAGKCGCPAGLKLCGTACCKAGVACANRNTSTCAGPAALCLPDFAPCGSRCCSPGQTCQSGACVCFIGATRVLMADGSERRIDDVEVGDWVLGSSGQPNLVLYVERPPLEDRLLYALNDDDYFVTAEHPFLTTAGWKSIDPRRTAVEGPILDVEYLMEGDHLLAASAPPAALTCGTVLTATALHEITLTTLRSRPDDPSTTIYNLKLDGDHTYFANGFVVHNR